MCDSNKEFYIEGASFQIHPNDIATQMVTLVIKNIKQFKLFLNMSRDFPTYNSEGDFDRFKEQFKFQCTLLKITLIEQLFEMYIVFFEDLVRSKKKFMEYIIGLLTPCFCTHSKSKFKCKNEPRILDRNHKIIGNDCKVDVVCYSLNNLNVNEFYGEFIECKFNASNFLSYSNLSRGAQDKLTYMGKLRSYFIESEHCYFAFATLLQGDKTKRMLEHHQYDFIQVLDDKWLAEKIKENR